MSILKIVKHQIIITKFLHFRLSIFMLITFQFTDLLLELKKILQFHQVVDIKPKSLFINFTLIKPKIFSVKKPLIHTCFNKKSRELDLSFNFFFNQT